jgi:AcrR family transcriptional regulator
MPTPRENTVSDKRTAILDAAQNLFLRYGIKRTSLDDVAREAGVAKGTLYLYFDSKDTIFAAIAERFCADVLCDAEAAIAASSVITQQVVGALDAYLGAPCRLVEDSPHVAELTESKEAVAAATFATMKRKVLSLLRTVLRNGGIDANDAVVEMFFAAAIGTHETGDTAAKPYRARLTAITDILIEGLKQKRPRD